MIRLFPLRMQLYQSKYTKFEVLHLVQLLRGSNAWHLEWEVSERVEITQLGTRNSDIIILVFHRLPFHTHTSIGTASFVDVFSIYTPPRFDLHTQLLSTRLLDFRLIGYLRT